MGIFSLDSHLVWLQQTGSGLKLLSGGGLPLAGSPLLSGLGMPACHSCPPPPSSGQQPRHLEFDPEGDRVPLNDFKKDVA